MSEPIKRILALGGDTLIPISFVSAIMGSGWWMNNVTARTDAIETRLEVAEKAQERFKDFAKHNIEEQTKALTEIKVHTAAMDAKLSLLLDMKKR